jgi:CDP-glucose 4,6-dehydratase
MIPIFNKYYNNKRVLVTGHTGFKGAWLSIWLTELGAKVYGYSLDPPTEPSMYATCGLHNRMEELRADVLEYNKLKNYIAEIRPEIVFHLAAQSLVRYSYVIPKLTLETNVLGTLNILEAVRECDSVRSLIIVTSDKCYENHEQVYGYKETDPLGGEDPYSASKAAAEILFRSYLKSFYRHNEKLGAVSVRAGNVIGGGDWAMDRIIPDAIKALTKSEPIRIRNPRAIRPWQHVLEPLSGYLWLGARASDTPAAFSGAWNFGPSDSSAKSVRDLVETILGKWKSGSYEVADNGDEHKLHEAGWLRLTCDKAHVMLPWSAILSFDENIRMTVEWYKNYYDQQNQNMYHYTVHQIHHYIDLALKQGQPWASHS